MTNLVVKKDGIEVIRKEINNVFISGKEITLTLKEKSFFEVPIVKDEYCFITIENDLDGGIPEKPALYKSYMFSLTDDKLQQQDKDGNIIYVPTNVVSANQLLFLFL